MLPRNKESVGEENKLTEEDISQRKKRFKDIMVGFIINLYISDISLQQMKSFTSPKFTGSQMSNFNGGKIKQTFIHSSFDHFASEDDKRKLAHTHKIQKRKKKCCPSLKFQLETTDQTARAPKKRTA